MGSLRVNAFLYEGRNYYYRSPRFEKNLVIVEGQNGNGKSTFCKLIYHGLGGSVDEFKKTSKEQHQEVVNDVDNYIELDISIGSDSYLVRRLINDNEITVTPYSLLVSDDEEERVSLNTQGTEILPINRSENKPFTFSDWILSKLKIEVIELNYGAANFKIKFNDLFRLMFHDQSPDPNYIYKRPDSDNFISDSILIRKVIFELLMGKTYSDYYKAVSLRRDLEKEKSTSKAIFAEYESIARELRGSSEPRNSTFLKKEIEDNDIVLEKLHFSREALKKPRAPSEHLTDLQYVQNEVLANELELGDRKKAIYELYREKARLLELRSLTKTEVEQVAKIIHTHSQLNIFSADTCPYCLSKVDRPKDHCVCGALVEEAQYERFFYSEVEYKELLKSKQAAFKSIDIALTDCEADEINLVNEIHMLEKRSSDLKQNLSVLVNEIDDATNTHAISEIDDKILDFRDKNAKLLQLLDIEIKLEKLEKNDGEISTRLGDAKRNEKILELNAQADIAKKVAKFSTIYNNFMTKTLKNCRSAKIDSEDYTPIINDYEYKEDSSRVHKRLMYYLTLLKISMDVSEVTAFPRFLLIDTPDTAGIDKDHLLDAIIQIDQFLTQDNFQIILTTGVGIYPPKFDSYVAVRLRDEDKLLKRKSII
jgi:hypothetical protein